SHEPRNTLSRWGYGSFICPSWLPIESLSITAHSSFVQLVNTRWPKPQFLRRRKCRRQPLCWSTACSACPTGIGVDPYGLRSFFFDRPQHTRGLLHVLGLHPYNCPIAPLPRCHRIAGRHIDLGLGQLGDDLSKHAGSIFALDQEPGLGTHQGKFRFSGGSPKGGSIGRNEIDLGSPPFGKTRVGQ